MAEAPNSDYSPVTIKDLIMDKKIGKGQFSEVFRARNVKNNEVVALKKIQVSHPPNPGIFVSLNFWLP